MKISQYYVHFENPQPLDNIEATIFALDPDAHIIPIFSGSFLIAAATSYSSLQHALDTRFNGTPRILMKIKENSAVHVQGKTPPTNL